MDYSKYGSDKETEHGYFSRVYESLFGHLRGHPVEMLELGLWGGGCLHLWRDFFGQASKITGLDINPIDPKFIDNERTFFYQGNQIDEPLMEKIGRERGPFDVIVDDASHSGHETWASLLLLWRWLKPGGIYVVEDIFYAWPVHDRVPDGDGKMLGFIQNVVKHLPKFQADSLGMDYRVQSGVLWLHKHEDAST